MKGLGSLGLKLEVEFGEVLWGLFQNFGGSANTTSAIGYIFCLWNRAKHLGSILERQNEDKPFLGF